MTVRDDWYTRLVALHDIERQPPGIGYPDFATSPSHPGDSHEDPSIPRPKPPDLNQIARDIAGDHSP